MMAPTIADPPLIELGLELYPLDTSRIEQLDSSRGSFSGSYSFEGSGAGTRFPSVD